MAYSQTTTQLQAYLAELYAARSALLLSKSYSIGGKNLTRVDEKWLSDEIAKTENRVNGRTYGRTLNPVFDGTR